MLGTEIVVSGCMIVVVGRGGFDRRSIGTILKSLLACAVAVAVHGALESIGPVRLLVDAVVYTAIVLATGALRLGEMVALAREAIRRRRG